MNTQESNLVSYSYSPHSLTDCMGFVLDYDNEVVDDGHNMIWEVRKLQHQDIVGLIGDVFSIVVRRPLTIVYSLKYSLDPVFIDYAGQKEMQCSLVSPSSSTSSHIGSVNHFTFQNSNNLV